MKSLLTAAVAFFFYGTPFPQQVGDPPVIRSESRLVVVDTIVTDRKGAYIGGLTREDFKVLEDGKVQTISTFSAESSGQKHNFVLYFDNPTIPPVKFASTRDLATKFIAAHGGPNNLMAVAELDTRLRIAQNFTDDVERLQQAVTRANSIAGVGSTRRPALGAQGSPPVAGPASLEALRNLAQGLAAVPGRKTLVFFTGGMVQPDQVRALIDACNRANVAVYPVNVGDPSNRYGSPSTGQNGAMGGPFTAVRGGPPAAMETQPVTFESLAAGTGGTVVSGSDLSGGLEKAATEPERYYVLGYVPAKDADPGACHTIAVKVAHGGATVRSRTGYCETRPLDALAGTPTQHDLEVRLTGEAAPTINATVQAPFFYVAADTARVHVLLDIPGAAVKFTKAGDRFVAKLNLAGVVSFADGGVAAHFTDIVRFNLGSKQEMDDFAGKPYHYEKDFEIPPGKLSLKVAFTSAADSFGRVETGLTVDPWKPGQFLLSGLAISTSAVPAQVTPFGAASYEKVPLVVNGVQLIPAGTNRVSKSAKAYIYGEAYEPATAEVSAQLVVLDAKTGNPVQAPGTLKLAPGELGGPMVPMGIVLPVADIAPGAYIARITAVDSAGNKSTRSIPFELVQ